MTRPICLLVLLLSANMALHALTLRDSMPVKSGFHILVSLKPLTRAVFGSDSIENFMYSNTQFEVQYNFRRHYIGFGFNGTQKKSAYNFNGVPYESDRLKYAFAPSYSYMFHAQKRWKCFAGLGYIYNYEDKVTTIQSPIEVITNSQSVTEEGFSLNFRVNYRLRRHFSIELESSFYYTRSNSEDIENYPLTPSMNVSRTVYRDNRTYAFPSNILLKYSF